ncbi:amine sulfotransferase-like [Asterias amurensis]|uniref:amine sulfotransferase-like n=1 Tax=Asterias amurensis TaxID=7602 RepID=UPI003AB65736
MVYIHGGRIGIINKQITSTHSSEVLHRTHFLDLAHKRYNTNQRATMASPQDIQQKIMAIFANVKQEDAKGFDTYEYEGVHLAVDTLKSTMDDLKTFEIREDDVFIVTYPKSGTTWTQEIMSTILHDGNIEEVNKKHTILRVPFLEMTHAGAAHPEMPRSDKIVANMPRSTPRFIKSHLPSQLLPPQVWEKKIKMVYVIRNPKDTIVSFFHHGNLTAPHRNYQFDDVFERFLKNTLPFGSWWDHILKFWEKRNEDHVLVLQFKDMKKDLRGTVKQISEFLGKSFSDEILDAITDHCSFESMKNNPMTNPDTLIAQRLGKIADGKSFMRKGKEGGWKAQLSPSQSEALDALCQERLKDTGLTFEM